MFEPGGDREILREAKLLKAQFERLSTGRADGKYKLPNGKKLTIESTGKSGIIATSIRNLKLEDAKGEVTKAKLNSNGKVQVRLDDGTVVVFPPNGKPKIKSPKG